MGSVIAREERQLHSRPPPGADRPGPGREVSNRAVAATVMGCRLWGLDVTPLLGILGQPVEVAVDPRRRCAWDAYAELTDRIAAELGGSEAMEQMTFASLGKMESLRMFAALVLDVPALYTLGVERIARFMFPHMAYRVEILDDGRIYWEHVLPDRYRGCAAQHHRTTALARGYSTMLGLAEARVNAVITPHRGAYWITPPTCHDMMRQMRQSLASRSYTPSADDHLDADWFPIWMARWSRPMARTRLTFGAYRGDRAVGRRGTCTPPSDVWSAVDVS